MAATTGGIMVDTQARFGYTAAPGTTRVEVVAALGAPQLGRPRPGGSASLHGDRGFGLGSKRWSHRWRSSEVGDLRQEAPGSDGVITGRAWARFMSSANGASATEPRTNARPYRSAASLVSVSKTLLSPGCDTFT
ncbi:hypothetical protein EDD91_0015 [Streptomyces sp. KS 21]|nr:hypothetical protein EDD91_0015 [Streptomyces sp. KS 21]